MPHCRLVALLFLVLFCPLGFADDALPKKEPMKKTLLVAKQKFKFASEVQLTNLSFTPDGKIS